MVGPSMSSSEFDIVDVHGLAQMLKTTPPPVLLDVREQDEWQYCRIDGAQHVPMSQIQQRVRELDPRRDTVVYCHHGIRSQSVAEFLRSSGFSRVASLAGGIDDWSVRIDPMVPRY